MSRLVLKLLLFVAMLLAIAIYHTLDCIDMVQHSNQIARDRYFVPDTRNQWRGEG